MSNNNEKVDYTQWLKRGTSTFIPTDNAVTVNQIDSGVYNLKYTQNMGFYLYKKKLKLDDLSLIPSRESEEVMATVNSFWGREDKFKEYGFTFKRGILLYGPAGTGKTSIINLVISHLMKTRDAVVFILQDQDDLDLYRSYIAEVFRVIEPSRPILTIIEDIDGLCQQKNVETKLINILDGIEQIDNIFYIATTNFLEKLSDRLTNRPNRFDRRIKIGFPDVKARKFYIKSKLTTPDLKNIDLKMWIEKTDGMTISHIGELIKSVIIMGNDFEDTITMLNELKKKPSSFDYNKYEYEGDTRIGFTRKRSSIDIIIDDEDEDDDLDLTNH